MTASYADYSKMIDHSLLPPMLTEAELEAGCRLAVAYDVASVCILPYYMKRCTELLSGSTVKPSTTIGFPHGAIHTESKSPNQNERSPTAAKNSTWLSTSAR